METIYQNVIQQVSNGAQFSVDFKHRTLSINGKPVDLSVDTLGIEMYNNLDDWLDKVEDLYDAYKYSVPTKSSMAKARKAKFKALSVDQLIKQCGHTALNNPLKRDEAQITLEAFVLFSLLNGSFKPEELFKNDWFFQGSDKTLIMRKDWF